MIDNYVNINVEINILKDRKENLINEMNHINCLLDEKESVKNKIANHLKELDGIENKLYYQIVVLGKNVTAAVDYISFQCDKDVSTIWKSYYPNVKKKIKELNSLAQF